MAEDKIFVGSAKIITTTFGDLTKISFSEKDLQTLKENLKNGWVNTVLKEKKTKIYGKPTHYLCVDKWEPKPQDTRTAEQLKEQNDKPERSQAQSDGTDSLPF